MLCLTGTTGNIGRAVLSAILEHNLLPPDQLIISTSSDPSSPKFANYKSLGITIRQASFQDPASLEAAYAGCKSLFLVSSPSIQLDFDEPRPGYGRERHHVAAIEAAIKAGVKHVYYTSLAFGTHSKAGVMRAHDRTEAYMEGLKGMIGYTSIREGLYAESWPLYFGQYEVGSDTRKEIIVGGDGPVSWTAIEDLGLGTALIIADNDKSAWRNRTVYLSAPYSATLEDVAKVVSKAKGEEVSLKVVSREEFERVSIEERKMDPGFVRWWATSYDALLEGECDNTGTRLENLLQKKGKSVTRWEDIVERMVKGELEYSTSEGRKEKM